MSFASRFRYKLGNGNNWKNAIAVGTGLLFILSSPKVDAAEEIIITYGSLSQSLQVKDLTTFAQTGEMSSSIRFLVDIAKQNPEQLGQILTQELGVGLVFLSDILNSSPGEYALSEVGQVIQTKSRRANVESLRGALVTSATDNQVSLLEFLQNYPTQQIYVDGDQLFHKVNTVRSLVNQVDKYLELPLEIIQELSIPR
jgi:hypothetical protein